MQKIINRFWDWFFHPSIRIYKYRDNKASLFGYPSPGNITNDYTDYKTPYEHTQLDVRYARPVQSQSDDKVYQTLISPLAIDPITKLKKVGLLKKGLQSNIDAVSEAKEKFKQKYGFSAEQRVYRNDTDEIFLNSIKREDISAYIQSYYKNLSNSKYDETDYALDKQVINDPQMVPLQSVDMFTAPHFQQGRINNQYMIEYAINENKKKESIDVVVGDGRFWKAIDDSFDTTEVANLQTAIGDPDPTDFTMQSHSKVEFQKDSNGEIINLHPKH